MRRRHRFDRRGAVPWLVALVLLVPACSGPTPPTTPSFSFSPGPSIDINAIIRDILNESGPAAAPGDQGPQSQSLGAVNVSTLDDFELAVARSVSAYWNDAFQKAGKTWDYPKIDRLDGSSTAPSKCTDAATGQFEQAGDPDLLPNLGLNPAFYCSEDNVVYVSTQWLYDHAWEPHILGDGTLRLGGDFAVAYAIAHEMGHTVQNELQLIPPADTPVIGMELQADCLAGVWANAQYYAGTLETGDIQEALNEAADVSDTDPDPAQHHGTAAQRQGAFLIGYNSGLGGDCQNDLQDRLAP